MLLSWYRQAARDLPWRRSRDPYRVLVSEVMLQQTRVETVLRYYDAFLDAFPTVGALAAAAEEEVLARWSGLGYYRRARRLWAAAREVIQRGGFPESTRSLEELPGVGAYTAAAVASIAFGEKVPVLDGNVERVLCRALGCEQDPRRAAVRRELLQVARSWLDGESPGESNQALMELGALLCAPRAPRCGCCPLRPGCWALRHDCVETLPRRPVQRRRVRVRLLMALVEQGGRVLLVRRSRKAELLPGMWELPTFACEGEEGSDHELRDRDPASALQERLLGRFGQALARAAFEEAGAAATFHHAITFRDLEVTVQRFRMRPSIRTRATRQPGWIAERAEGEPPAIGWFLRSEIEDLPTSSLVAKALALCPP